MLNSFRFFVCIFVHLYYRGYLRMLKMYSYMYLFIMHSDKVINKQSMQVYQNLFVLVCVCLPFFWYWSVFEATIDQLTQLTLFSVWAWNKVNGTYSFLFYLLKNIVKIKMCKYSNKQLNSVYKTDKNHVRLFNRKHVIDRHVFRLIHWIGESVWRKYWHMLNNAIHIW